MNGDQQRHSFALANVMIVVLSIFGCLLMFYGGGWVINGYKSGMIPLGIGIFASGILFIAAAVALALIRDIADRVINGVSDG